MTDNYDFTPSISRNPQLHESMTKFATDLACHELLYKLFPDYTKAGHASLHLIAGGKAINELERLVDDMVEDMVMDSFYKMLDEMRSTMEEYKPYIIEAMEE